MKINGQLECEVRYPTSSGTFNKEPDYILGLQDDLDRLLHEEFLDRSHTPTYVARIGQAVGPSRECFLFTQKLVAPSKQVEQHQPRPTTAPPPSARPRFVKTNNRHQFLAATDSGREVDIKHGRPTRTTILRARHRINSAPPVSEERCSQRAHHVDSVGSGSSRRPPSAESARRMGESGETAHQFLIGARYNTAHYVDRKAIERYGVYMPRQSPGHFFTKAESTRQTTPRSRPASPVEAWNQSTRPTSASSTTMAAPSTPRPPTPAADAADSVLAALMADEVAETVEEAPATVEAAPEPLTVRGSRIYASSGPGPTPRGSVTSGSERRAGPVVPSPSTVRSPLPRVVGLSLGASRPHPDAFARSRRILVTARIGGPALSSPAAIAQRRAGGVAAGEITRAFSVRPWRDPRSIRKMVREAAESQRVEQTTHVPAVQVEDLEDGD